MSDEKLEALLWNENDDSPVWIPGVCYFHLTKNEAKECNRRIRAAHALGVEEGKREARDCDSFDSLPNAVHLAMHKLRNAMGSDDWCPSWLIEQAIKRLRDAAPVDDGTRYEFISVKTCEVMYPGFRVSRDLATEFVKAHNGQSAENWITFRTARPVEPKHVHEWGQAYLDGHRNCLHCDARQVAEWKDEVTK